MENEETISLETIIIANTTKPNKDVIIETDNVEENIDNIINEEAKEILRNIKIMSKSGDYDGIIKMIKEINEDKRKELSSNNDFRDYFSKIFLEIYKYIENGQLDESKYLPILIPFCKVIGILKPIIEEKINEDLKYGEGAENPLFNYIKGSFFVELDKEYSLDEKITKGEFSRLGIQIKVLDEKSKNENPFNEELFNQGIFYLIYKYGIGKEENKIYGPNIIMGINLSEIFNIDISSGINKYLNTINFSYIGTEVTRENIDENTVIETIKKLYEIGSLDKHGLEACIRDPSFFNTLKSLADRRDRYDAPIGISR